MSWSFHSNQGVKCMLFMMVQKTILTKQQLATEVELPLLGGITTVQHVYRQKNKNRIDPEISKPYLTQVIELYTLETQSLTFFFKCLDISSIVLWMMQALPIKLGVWIPLSTNCFQGNNPFDLQLTIGFKFSQLGERVSRLMLDLLQNMWRHLSMSREFRESCFTLSDRFLIATMLIGLVLRDPENLMPVWSPLAL